MNKKEDIRLANAMSPGKPRPHVTEVANEIFGISPRPLPNEQLIEIPLTCIFSSQFQVRSVADAEYIDQLAESIQETGVVSPIIVRRILEPNIFTERDENNKLLESNNFELVAGHHRVEACKKLGATTIKAVIRELSDAAAAMVLTVDNAVRKNLTDYEKFKHIVMLQGLGACKTQKSTARALGVSQSLISFLKSYASLPIEAIQLLELAPDVLGATYAAQLKPFSASHPEVVTEAVGLMVSGHLKPSSVVLWVAKKISKPVRSFRRETKIKFRESDVRLVFKRGKVEIFAEGLNPDAVERMVRDNLDDLISC